MKCDHIRTRAQGDKPFFPNMLNNANVEVCLKEDVDKALAEKDKEIALLKERICNGDVSRATWIDDCLDKDKEIADLKCRLASAEEDRDYFKNIRNERHEEEIAELKQKLAEKESWVKMLGEGEAALSLELEKTKQKLENVQASMYADVVDANMENRRLKEERRWRKFHEEKPEHHQWILVFYPNHSQFTTGVELRRWDDGCKYDVEEQGVYDKWMPLPKAPKEADK